VSLQIRKDGFATLDTTVQINSDNLALDISLETEQPVMSNQFTTTGGPGTVVVNSSPSNAEVWVNGNRMGTTPFRQELDEGSYQVRVTEDGYMDFSRSVNVSESETVDLTANLQPAGALTINSTPAGATVYLDNNRTRYTTPFRTSKIETGSKRVGLRMDGYQNFDTTLTIRQNNTTAIAPRLTPATGQLVVLVRPFGTIYVDGEVKARDTSAPFTEELPAGTHNIRVVHQTLGRWDKTVNLAANETEEVLFNFNQTFTVTITSEPNYGEIYINGEATGEYTPKQVTLHPGEHTIDVRKEGFVLPGGPKTVTIEGDRTDQPLHFSLQQS
ncbi:MAG: PEGA domain-containing protein, partial [Candidatus Marinimicrobia bacterium]|nr:PEGA domain-containing protein [Candidatus Neomarinimicrobiota bacterium]